MVEPEPELSKNLDDAIRFLPHSGPSLLVTKTLEMSADHMVCLARFPSKNALVSDGCVPSYAAVEPAAQTAAVHQALVAISNGVALEELSGFLTSLKRLAIHQPTLPADTDLTVKVMPRGHIRGLSKYTFEVSLGNVLACEGEFSSFVQNELEN